MAGAERSGHRHRHLGFRFDHTGAHLGHAGRHFLFHSHGCGTPDFGVGLSDEFVGFSLLGLKFGADIFAHAHIRNVEGQDFKRGVGIERLVEDSPGNAVGVFQHVLVGGRRTDAADDALPNARDDGLLRRPTHKAVQIGAHRHQRPSLDDDAVLGHAIDGDFTQDGSWAINHPWVNGCSHGFDHGFAGALGGQVNGARAVKDELDAGLFGGNEGEHDHRHVAAGHKMRGQIVDAEGQARSHGGDAVVHDQARRNAPQAQGDQLGNGDFSAGKQGTDIDRPEINHDDGDNEQQHSANAIKQELPFAGQETGLSKN